MMIVEQSRSSAGLSSLMATAREYDKSSNLPIFQSSFQRLLDTLHPSHVLAYCHTYDLSGSPPLLGEGAPIVTTEEPMRE